MANVKSFLSVADESIVSACSVSKKSRRIKKQVLAYGRQTYISSIKKWSISNSFLLQLLLKRGASSISVSVFFYMCVLLVFACFCHILWRWLHPRCHGFPLLSPLHSLQDRRNLTRRRARCCHGQVGRHDVVPWDERWVLFNLEM